MFDLGVNRGGFARLVAPKCEFVIGFEPDPASYTNLSLPPNVRVVPKAIAAKGGTMSFNVNADLCSSLHYAEAKSQSIVVEAITLSEALALEPEKRIDLIKMDIEGEEVEVLLNAPSELFTRVVQMTVEFHDFLDPSSISEIKKVIARLQKLNFHAVRFSWNSFGDMLFVNQDLVPLKLWQRMWLRLRYKYARGGGRLLKRILKR